MRLTANVEEAGPASAARMSPRVVMVLLLVIAIPLAYASPVLAEPSSASAMALLMYALSGALWALHAWNDELGRWTSVIALTVVIVLLRYALPFPGLLVLSALGPVLASAIVGVRAAVVVGAILTALLSLALIGARIRLPAAEAGLALALIWGTGGILLWTFHAVADQVHWSWEHFERHRSLLEMARDRQVQLKEALEALGHANRELGLANDRLAVTRLAAESARNSKAAFVANVSHELRTPLNIVIGLAEILLRQATDSDEPLPPGVREDLAILFRNCEHLSSMINDVLDLSQVEAGRLALHREWVDVGALVHTSLRIIRPLLQQKGLQLHAAIPPALPPAYCDARRIRQVVLNLLSNAARYTEEGSVTVGAEVRNDSLVIRVADTGPGVSEQEAKRVFEPFHQGASGAKNGSGLGLSISRQFVELHGGQMWLESRPGVGSTFSFRLPITPPPAPLEPASRWVTEGWTERTVRVDWPAAASQERLVLCDPTGEAYQVLVRYTDRMEFIRTSTPAEALQALDQSSAQAVWVSAPAHNALWPLIDEIRADQLDVPIIGFSLPTRYPADLPDGCAGFLLKPILQHHLEEAILRLGRSPRTVLIADDDPDTLYTLSKMLRLQHADLKITTATQGKEALDAIRERRPGLVLLDVIMPEMDGWQVLAAMSQEGLRDIPVLLISALDPRDQPIAGNLVVGTVGRGLSINKLVRCAGALSGLLLRPD